jgi:DNA mismatch repair protein PMS2
MQCWRLDSRRPRLFFFVTVNGVFLGFLVFWCFLCFGFWFFGFLVFLFLTSCFKALDHVEAVFPDLDVKMQGLVSSLNSGCGRRSKDRHFFFLNKRPVDLPVFGKVVTECFRVASANQGKFPTIILNFTLKSEHIDLNVTPEKRTVFVAIEAKLLEAMREFMSNHYGSSHSAEVPLVVNEAAQTGAIPKRFAPPLINRNLSAPSPKSATIVQSVLAPPPSSLNSGSPKLFEAFGFRRSASAPPLQSSPVTVVQQEVKVDHEEKQHRCEHGCNHYVVDWSAPIEIEEEQEDDVVVEILKAEGQEMGPKEHAAPKMPPGNMFADLFAFGATKATRVEKQETAPSIPAASPDVLSFPVDSIEIPLLPSPSKRSKVSYLEDDDDQMVIDFSQDVPLQVADARPLEREEEEENDVVSSFLGSSSSGPVLEVDLEEIRNRLKRRREPRSQPSQGNAGDLLSMFKKDYFNRLHVVGQFNKGFIITRFENSSDLFIVDQHASNEIFNFETLQKSTALRVQRLLAPISLQFSPDEEIDVISNLHVFERNGFLLECDEFAAPGKKVKLVGRPESKDTVFGESDVRCLGVC